tara:strand:+ start:4660 stop:5040 length:381 start_codon:yes stop_codon:yes gene_type:complete
LKLFGKIHSNKIVWKNKTQLVDHIRSFKEGTVVSVEIIEAEESRSINQNRLWWKWIEILSKETGNTKEDMHTLMKYKYLLKEKMIEGELHQIIGTTTTLSKEEFSKLMKEMFFWANDTLNVMLPNE